MELKDVIIGRNIRNARQKNELTQTDLAMRLNVSRSLIAQYETGRKKADREFLEKIAANMSACTVEELEHVSEEDLREAARASQQTIGQRFSENMTKEMLEAYRQNCIANGLDVICDFNGLSASFLSMMEKDLDLHISLEINDDKKLEDYITYDEETMLISPWDVKEVVVTALRISRKTGGQNEVRIPVADYREFQNNITSICGLLYNTLEKQSGTVPDGQEGKVWRA
jgi:transcriptional regulator with XRE-family HTH domain